MSGIERLRKIAYNYRNLSKNQRYLGINVLREADLLTSIASQIERERVSRMRVLSVVTEMERHILGHEGADDSPVARWARELREALGGEGRDPADDVSMSAYDLLPQEEREAIAWVRDHGGLEKIIQQRRDSVPRAAFERKLGKRLRHIAECEEALRRRNATISALEKAADSLRKQIAEMLPRLMPEGMEWLVESWPRFEDGKPVRIGDVVSDVEVRSVVFRDDGILLSDCTSVPGWGTWRSYKEPIKRPAPKVSDADGVEIRVGDEVYQMGCKYRVSHLHGANGNVRIVYENSGRWVDPKTLTHRAPVLAADGRPLREGETVYEIETGDRYFVTRLFDGMTEPDFPEHTVECRKYEDVVTHMFKPSQLTHERPDSWERLEEDAEKNPCDYFGFDGEETCGRCPASGKNCEQTMALDIVRRARALAERERGE